jgi:ferrous iron transport protein B
VASFLQSRDEAMTPPIVLIGNPNVGKSALFGALTGAYVAVSNYPGTTVELAEGGMDLSGARVSVVDTPGVASLLPVSEDERVTRALLTGDGPTPVAVVVADAKNLERALVLVLELSELAVPLVLCLNMTDEAEEHGVSIDPAGLAHRLGVPVVPTVAIRHEGISELKAALAAAAVPGTAVDYGDPIETAARTVASLLGSEPRHRGLALLALSGDGTLEPWLRANAEPRVLQSVEAAKESLERAVGPASVLVAAARQRAAARLAAIARTETARRSAARRFREWAEWVTTHRVWGWPMLAAVLTAVYAFVGVLGAGTLVELVEDGIFGRYVNPAAIRAAALLPWAFARDLLVGPYGVVTMALTYALALVLPIVSTFFLAFGALEDSGYLPRLAVMVNRAFRAMGLSGKAVLPMVLGLGCDTMATLTTRVLETSRERLIVILLLALGVPCSAQLAVVLGLLRPLPVAATVIWLAVVLGSLFLVGRLASTLIPGRSSDFILELPPLRVPRLGNVVVKTLARVEWYVKEAVPLFVLGTLVLFAADRLHLLGLMERAGRPVVSGLLGLPPAATEAFVIGFLRRDFGAAGLFRLSAEGALAPAQVVVAVVTITLFIPCIANFFMIVKERGLRTALAVAAFVIPFAVGVGALLRVLLASFPRVLG